MGRPNFLAFPAFSGGGSRRISSPITAAGPPGSLTLFRYFRLIFNAGIEQKSRSFFFVIVHRTPHLLCSRALEVRRVRLRARRRTSEAPCKRLPVIGCFSVKNNS